MLNEQPKDITGFIINQNITEDYIGEAIEVSKASGVFLGMGIFGSSTNLVGIMFIEAAAEGIGGNPGNRLWCPIISDAVASSKFASTDSNFCGFDLTFTQAKFVRVRFKHTSSTGTATLGCDAYIKPL